jgi:putative aldouronate transport system permease protein
MSVEMTPSVKPAPRWLKRWGADKVYNNVSYLTMILPGAVWLFLFAYLPMPGIIMAFKTYTFSKPPADFWIQNKFIYSLLSSPWVGLKNFEYLTLPSNVNSTLTYIRNTVFYNLLFMVVGLVFQVALAVIIFELSNRFWAKLYHSVLFLPYFISWIVVAYVVYALGSSNGILNSVLASLHLDSFEIYRIKAAWPVIFTVANLWKYTGNGSIIYLAVITGIDPEQYEAAAIDGAGKWKQFLNITLPNLVPVIVLLQILAVGRIFGSDFDMFYTLPNGAAVVKDVTYTLDIFVYNMLRSGSPLGYPAAAAFLQSIVGFILIMVTNQVVRRTRPELSLF